MELQVSSSSIESTIFHMRQGVWSRFFHGWLFQVLIIPKDQLVFKITIQVVRGRSSSRVIILLCQSNLLFPSMSCCDPCPGPPFIDFNLWKRFVSFDSDCRGQRTFEFLNKTIRRTHIPWVICLTIQENWIMVKRLQNSIFAPSWIRYSIFNPSSFTCQSFFENVFSLKSYMNDTDRRSQLILTLHLLNLGKYWSRTLGVQK